MPENDIIIKITGEADLDAAQKQLQELTKRSEDYEKQIEQLKEKEKQVSASLRNSIKDRKELSDVLIKTQQHYRNQRKALQDNITANKQSIKALTDQVKAYKTLHGQSGRMVTQLRSMREELQRMEESGEFGSEAFVELSIAAGKLEDQIGDTQQRIRILASDTKNMDAAMGLGDGLAGSFYIATSGAELFGGEMEGLQQAFYKVQAAMSVVSGIQQVYNSLNKDSAAMVVLNTALTKIMTKAKTKNAAANAADAAASTADSAAKVAQSAATSTATAAQWSLNAAMAANPIGAVVAIVLVAVALIAALAVGIGKLVHSFSEAGKAERDYAKASEEFEQIHAKNAVNEEFRQHKHSENLRKTDNAEKDALAKAQKRGASEIELAKIKSKYAKQRADETRKFANQEIRINNEEVAKLKEMRDAAAREANAYREGTEDKKEALEKLTEAQNNYIAAVEKGKGLEQQRIDADRAAEDAEQELAEKRKERAEELRQISVEAERANIELMRAGAAKEIAQINLDYREKLRAIKGQSKEEKALRKALAEQQEREIQSIRDKYAQQALKTEIQNRKNSLEKMSQSAGDEESYQEQIALEKKILKLEAADQIKALQDSVQRKEMSEKEAAVKITAIRLQLQKDLNAIDEQDYQRTAENAKRRAAIFVKEAENETNLLNGSEPIAEQLEVWDHYYAQRKTQIEQNAQFEKEAAQRAFARGEMSAEQLADREREIQANLNSDIENLRKEGAAKVIEVNDQYLSDLELAADKAAHAMDHAQPGGKLDALKANLDAQLDLYDAQQAQLDAKWEAGLISFQNYKQQEWEIEKATIDAETQYRQNAMQAIADGFQTALGYMQQISDLAFDAINQNIQAQLDALDEEYTTDWQEAQKSADKKYITEKEYEKKKAALEEKQAKYQKTQAIINAAIQTALAIVTTLAQLGATPWGIAASVIAGAMGAAQIAVIASKPLAQYEKGRKGGKGEYALVGEKGPELMYVPAGASIVPNNKLATPADWVQYGIPVLPHTNPDTLRYATDQTAVGFSIDYDRLGASVAAALPKQRSNNVTVNVDRSGVHVNNGGDSHTYLNAKYQGSWN